MQLGETIFDGSVKVVPLISGQEFSRSISTWCEVLAQHRSDITRNQAVTIILWLQGVADIIRCGIRGWVGKVVHFSVSRLKMLPDGYT